MQTDSDYWRKISDKWNRDPGYYWFRDSPHTEPEIVRISRRRPDAKFFDDEYPVEIHMEFAFGYAESLDMTLSDILLRFNGHAEISFERIIPPKD